VPEAPNVQERLAKAAQVLSTLNENLFDFIDFVVKKAANDPQIKM
jgi:hypothetical protein